jgi:hypothetical protein
MPAGTSTTPGALAGEALTTTRCSKRGTAPVHSREGVVELARHSGRLDANLFKTLHGRRLHRVRRSRDRSPLGVVRGDHPDARVGTEAPELTVRVHRPHENGYATACGEPDESRAGQVSLGYQEVGSGPTDPTFGEELLDPAAASSSAAVSSATGTSRPPTSTWRSWCSRYTPSLDRWTSNSMKSTPLAIAAPTTSSVFSTYRWRPHPPR